MADAAAKPKKGGLRPDFATLGGILLATAGIVGGLILEGGELSDITQVTAGLIVLGGTFGATLVNTPLSTFFGGLKALADVFFERTVTPNATIEEIIRYATRARKAGIVSLEDEVNQASDPFLVKALTLAVDGTDLQELRKMMELEIQQQEHHGEAAAKVFEVAGGYSPTIGIIGAVMGLIQVMKNLSDIDKVGHGIAVSFVATVYGVALANIFLLPAANKMKARVLQDAHMREMMLEGVTGIVEGLNPKLIRSKLEAYAPPKPEKPKKGALPVPETEAGD
ncbi:MAG: flagellar motor protein [Bryobacterales bacterium]|nr:flagellar motor protein [Bryobacterales bacterium]